MTETSESLLSSCRLGGEPGDGAPLVLGLGLPVGGVLPVGEDQQDGQLAGPDGELGEPAERFEVGPVQVVDDHHQRGAPRGELGEDVVEAVAHALRIESAGPALRLLEAHGRSDDLFPGAHHLPELVGGEVAEDGLEQLAQDVVRLVELALAAAGEEHRGALAELGDPADLVEQAGLADAGPAGEREQLADLGAAGRELPAELLHRGFGRPEFGVAVAQPDPG